MAGGFGIGGWLGDEVRFLDTVEQQDAEALGRGSSS
jgi:hypothetical protein